MAFDSKQFEIKREDLSIATWTGSKDNATLAQLIALFRAEKWRGKLVINFSGNGGVTDIVFTEAKRRRVPDEPSEEK